MSDTRTPAIAVNRRPSMLGQVNDSALQQPPSREGVNWFKLRTSYQQFMRENEPLFCALASSSDDPFTLLQGGSFAAAAAVAKAIAIDVAQRVSHDDNPSTMQIRPFRTAAATMVASAWQRGTLENLDVKAIGAELAAVTANVDDNLDRSLFSDTTISDQGSLNMTAMAVAMRLMEPVMTYDFRRDRIELISTMAEAVMTASAEAAIHLVPPDSAASERRTVVQTLANCFAGIMARIYERKAKHYISHVIELSQDEQERFARHYEPMTEVLQSFGDNARVYSGAAYASARAATQAADMATGEENTMRG